MPGRPPADRVPARNRGAWNPAGGAGGGTSEGHARAGRSTVPPFPWIGGTREWPAPVGGAGHSPAVPRHRAEASSRTAPPVVAASPYPCPCRGAAEPRTNGSRSSEGRDGLSAPSGFDPGKSGKPNS
ncbi:hypothetical protein GCM10017667_76310 [Streptomyces filamentosus]|uniref:Uncharacterized protein n=1 Tax=Streptomyces filamentosus TaxID=67294 RepID=A0A919BY69_STRFL|nr:hypothetical protein GCM10017667_76310 [Streptomyces filamentosus]